MIPERSSPRWALGKAAAMRTSLIWAGALYLAALALAARASGPAALRATAIPRQELT